MIGKRTLPVHIPSGLGFTSVRIAWLKGHPSNSTLILKVLLFKMFALGIKSGHLTSGSDTSLEIFSMLRANQRPLTRFSRDVALPKVRRPALQRHSPCFQRWKTRPH